MHRLLHSVLFSFFSLLFSLSITFAQNTKPVAQQVQYLHSEGFTFETFSPFKPAFKPSTEIQQALREVQMLELDEAVLSDIMSRRPEYVTLEIPYKGETMRIDLYQHNILGNQFAVLTGDDERQFYSPGLYYRGVLADDPNTICSFSFFEKEIMGFVSTSYTGNLVIGRVEAPGNRTRYVFYDDRDLQAPRSFECAARDIEGQAPVKLDHDVMPELINGCVEMFLEVDFALYTNRGTMANTVNYISGLFNQMATLYSNEQISIRIAQVYVWTAQDPYPTNDSFSALSTFQTQRVNWVGDLAHLVSLGGQNIGGVAWVNAICSTANGYAYSNIWSTYSSVPTYSWSVEVLTHETGHNMGSNHTHWCGWTGGALDNCYTTEGGCAAGPAPTNGGTIMSYCHLASYGINFNNGFGTQPGDVIRARVTTAYNSGNGCITASCTPPTCAAPANISVSSVTTTTATVTWTTIAGATGYNLQYRLQNGSTWTTVNNAANPYTINGLTANTLYEAQVQTVCSGGNSTYQNAVIFKSGDLPCTVPSSLTASSITTTSAALNWTDTNSGPTWEVQYGPRGFTLGSGTIVTTSTKPYTVSGLSHSRNYEFYVRALCTGGTGNSVWSSAGSFTTTLSNNQASGAVALTVGGSCPGNGAYSNIGSNTSTNEFSPTVANGGYWDTGISNTVWFSFVAPSSGSVKITTDIALTGTNKLDDTQIALYSTTNVNDYSLFRLLVSNEDGSTNNSGISTQVFYSGLTPGVTYYIQVDGWNTSTGAFCITVSETMDIATPTTSCQSYTATVNGTATGYSTLWFNVYSKPGTYDIGKPVAAIKTSQNLGTVTVQETRNASVQTHPNGVKYMQRYFNVNSSQNTAGSKSVRLFYTDTELSDFKTATGMGSATAEDLNISHYDGTTENCTPNDNTSGTVTLISGGNVTATSISSSGVFFLEFLSPGFSEMGSHFGLTPLPVEMLYFNGKAGRHTNVLEWATETENNLQGFTLERSADGISQWTALADIAPNAGKRYVYEDNTNLKKSYYRLKINDLDETSSLSSIVAIERSDRGTVAAVYPNPVSGLLYIQIEADEESDASIRVHSLDGRLMLEAAHSLFKGSNQIPLDMSALPAGAYILNITDGVTSNAPMRIIKE